MPQISTEISAETDTDTETESFRSLIMKHFSLTRTLDATTFNQLQRPMDFVKATTLNRPTKFIDQTNTLKLGIVSLMKGKTY